MAIDRILYGSQLNKRLEARDYTDIYDFFKKHEKIHNNQLNLKDLLDEESTTSKVLTKNRLLEAIEPDARYRVNGLNNRKTNLDYAMRIEEYESLDSGKVLVDIEFYSKHSESIHVPFLFDSAFDLSLWKNQHRHAFYAEFEWNEADYLIKVDAYINSKTVDFMLLYDGQDVSYRNCEIDLTHASDWESSARDWLGDLGITPKSIATK